MRRGDLQPASWALLQFRYVAVTLYPLQLAVGAGLILQGLRLALEQAAMSRIVVAREGRCHQHNGDEGQRDLEHWERSPWDRRE